LQPGAGTGSGEGALNGGDDGMAAAWDEIAENQVPDLPVCILDC